MSTFFHRQCVPPFNHLAATQNLPESTQSCLFLLPHSACLCLWRTSDIHTCSQKASVGKQSDWSLRVFFFFPNWKKVLSSQREVIFTECLKYCNCSLYWDEILLLSIKIPPRFKSKEEAPRFLLEAEKHELTWPQAVWGDAKGLRGS